MDITYKIGFVLLLDIFIIQFCNFSNLKANKLYVI